MMIIIGGTGTVGRELVTLLNRAQVKLQVVTRDGARARRLLGADIGIVQADLSAPDALSEVLPGAEVMFLLMGNRPDQESIERGVVRAAAAAGIPRIVKVSGFKPEAQSSRRIDGWHAAVEEEIRRSGVRYTMLRPSMFMQDFLLSSPTIRSGTFATSVGEGRVGCIDARDIAEVATKVLTEDGHDGAVYRLTGPASISFPDVARALSGAIGQAVRYQRIPARQEREQLLAIGVPAFLVDYLQALFNGFETGLGDEVTDHVQQITGRPPRSIEDFAADYARAFTG